jgi:hypothetical protein
MKKNSKSRLTLHRETVRTLASPELEAAQGGAVVVTTTYCITHNLSCGGTCNIYCVAPGTSQTC